MVPPSPAKGLSFTYQWTPATTMKEQQQTATLLSVSCLKRSFILMSTGHKIFFFFFFETQSFFTEVLRWYLKEKSFR